MAQSIQEIQEIIKQKVQDSEHLTPLDILTENQQDQITSTSRVSEWGRFVFVFAFVAWLQQKLYDVFKSDIEKRIAESQIHTKAWYRSKALSYQHGYDLIEDTDRYPAAVDFNDQLLIDASKVIKQAAIIKRGGSILRCKIATEQNGELSAVSEEVLTAFNAYMNEIVDAGTVIIPTSDPADDLKLTINIEIDPLVIDPMGQRLDGTNNTPVQDAINQYLKSLDFDGRLVINDLQSYVKNNTEGIRQVDIEYASSKYGFHTYDTVGVNNVGIINQYRTAESGYMKLDEFTSEFNFIVI